jgi:ABC-type multidrug transport system ATPase subunit
VSTPDGGVEVRTSEGAWRVRAGQRLVIGRDDDAGIHVDGPRVSRSHAVIEPSSDGTGYVLRDTSRNGVFVGDVRHEAVIRLEAPVTVCLGAADGPALHITPSVAPGDALVARSVRVVTRSGHVLVDDVTFALDGGSLLAVVGPSGSGKSTLLRALTGAVRPSGGTVQFDGRDVHAEHGVLRSRIGVVPQDDLVRPELTVRASLRYAAELRFPTDVGRVARNTRVEEVMTELALDHRAGTPIRSLSGGERKRVSVATELLTRPSLLLLDEPTSGLDPGLERSLMQTLRDLADDGDRTVVCVTHSVESLHLCDRVLFLAPGGQVAYFGPPAQAASYFERPDLQTVFQALSSETGWAERFAGSPLHDELVARPVAAMALTVAAPSELLPTDARRLGRKQWLRQLWTSTRRTARSLIADRRNLLILLATAPVLGLVFLLRLPTDQLRSLAPDEVPLFSRANAPLMLLSLAMTQLGINVSARQIVRELPLFRRERTVGLSPSAYLISKFAVMATIGAVQALVCVLIVLARQGGPDAGAVLSSGRAELVIVFFATWLAGMALGLLCSALATSESRLNLVLPAIIGLQSLAVTGTAITGIPSVPVLDQTEYVASASWGFTAAASTVKLNELNAFNDAVAQLDVLPERVDAVSIVDRTLRRLQVRDLNEVLPNTNSDFDHDPSAWWRAMLALVALTAAALAGAAVALRRHPPL